MIGMVAKALLTAAIMAAPVAARDDPADAEDGFALSWTVASHPVSGDDAWIKEQAAIVETRLVPTGLFVAEADVKDGTGKLLVPAGAQLLRLDARHAIACTIVRTATGLAMSKRVCLVDRDDDKMYESSFTRGRGGDYWMTLEGQLSRETLRPIAAAALRAIDPATMAEAPYASFHYQRILDGGFKLPIGQEGGNMVRFHLKVGTEKRREWMIRECRDPKVPSLCTSANFPSHFALAGLELDVLERRGEDIRVRVTHAFGGQAIKFREINDGYNSGELLLAKPIGE